MPRQEAHISFGLNESVTTRLHVGTADYGYPAGALVYLTDDSGTGPYVSFWHPEQMEALAADLLVHAADLRATQLIDPVKAVA